MYCRRFYNWCFCNRLNILAFHSSMHSALFGMICNKISGRFVFQGKKNVHSDSSFFFLFCYSLSPPLFLIVSLIIRYLYLQEEEHNSSSAAHVPISFLGISRHQNRTRIPSCFRCSRSDRVHKTHKGACRYYHSPNTY